MTYIGEITRYNLTTGQTIDQGVANLSNDYNLGIAYDALRAKDIILQPNQAAIWNASLPTITTNTTVVAPPSNVTLSVFWPSSTSATTSSTAATSSTSQPTNNAESGAANATNTAIVAGAAAGGGVVVLAIAIATTLYLKRRKLNAKQTAFLNEPSKAVRLESLATLPIDLTINMQTNFHSLISGTMYESLTLAGGNTTYNNMTTHVATMSPTEMTFTSRPVDA